jgi:hypothetical protein
MKSLQNRFSNLLQNPGERSEGPKIPGLQCRGLHLLQPSKTLLPSDCYLQTEYHVVCLYRPDKVIDRHSATMAFLNYRGEDP